MTALTSNNQKNDASRRAITILNQLAASPLKQTDIDRLKGLYNDTRSARIKAERGIEPLPLEVGLLLRRIAQGGHSGRFLADAFVSAYRIGQPFQHSLGELIRLDAEAFRLFHQILHIRHVPGWNDDVLHKVERQIKTIQEAQYDR